MREAIDITTTTMSEAATVRMPANQYADASAAITMLGPIRLSPGFRLVA